MSIVGPPPSPNGKAAALGGSGFVVFVIVDLLVRHFKLAPEYAQEIVGGVLVLAMPAHRWIATWYAHSDGQWAKWLRFRIGIMAVPILASLLIGLSAQGCAGFGKAPAPILQAGTIGTQSVETARLQTESSLDAWAEALKTSQATIHKLELKTALDDVTDSAGNAPVAVILDMEDQRAAAQAADEADIKARLVANKSTLAAYFVLASMDVKILDAYNRATGINPADMQAIVSNLSALATQYQENQAARAAASASKPDTGMASIVDSIKQQIMAQVAARLAQPNALTPKLGR